MLKDVIKRIDNAIPSAFPVDPTRFNDPVAMQTGWKQVRSGRLSRASSKLVQAGPDRLVYKPSIGSRIMGVVMVLVGALSIYLYFQARSGQGGATSTQSSGDPIFIALFGLVFVAVGVLLILLANSPVVFDKQLGLFYRGRKQQKNPDAASRKNALRFSEVHAVQLLTRLERINNTGSGDRMNSSNRTYPRYFKVHDLNLVRHDGERLYVTTYSKAECARTDAAMIGALINVPVWDGSDDFTVVPILPL